MRTPFKSFLVVLAICSSLARAEDSALSASEGPEFGSTAAADKDREMMGLKLGFQDYQYEESSPSGIKIDGKLLRLSADLRDNLNTGWSTPVWYSLDAGYAWGSPDVQGTNTNGLGGGTAFSGDSRDRNLEVEPHLGVSFFDSERQVLDVFLGVGYSASRSAPNIPKAYTREGHYYYAVAGLEYTFKPAKWISLNLGGQYNYIFSGKTKARFNEIDARFPDVVADITNGDGYRASLSAEMHDWILSPLVEFYWQKWEVRDQATRSKGIFTVTQPANETSIAGVNVGFRFSEVGM